MPITRSDEFTEFDSPPRTRPRRRTSPLTDGYTDYARARELIRESSSSTLTSSSGDTISTSRLGGLADKMKSIGKDIPKIKIELDIEKHKDGVKVVLKSNDELNELITKAIKHLDSRSSTSLRKAIHFNDYYESYTNRLFVNGIPNLTFLSKSTGQKSMNVYNVFTKKDIDAYFKLVNTYMKEMKKIIYHGE
jgi:hypothetical protein